MQAGERFDPVVEVLMTPRPITVEPSDPVSAAATIMRTCRVRHLPVVAPALVGMLAIGEVLAADAGARVGDVMSAPASSVAPAAPVTGACAAMRTSRRSCLAVVDGNALVGVFTATDALRFASVALDGHARRTRRPVEVAEVMTMRPLVTIAPTAKLSSAWETMRATGVRHLPVVTDGQLAGILSDRDVLAVGRGWRRDDGDILVGAAMSTRLSTIRPDRPASEAAATLLRRRVGVLPVLRGTDLRGMLKVTDFLDWILVHA